jgi:iron complex transport system substrate-binding protein
MDRRRTARDRHVIAGAVACVALVAATMAADATRRSATAIDTQPATHPRATPRRIISLVPALTEMLFAIGAGPEVVAVSSYDTFPAEAAARPKVGALLDPDVERILSLTPDLVAIYASQHDLRQQLQRVSIPIYDYRHAGLADILSTLRDLGRVAGHADEAERLASDIGRRLDGVRARVAGAQPVRTLLVFGREPGTLRNVYASGGKGFLHDMLVAAGGVNVFGDVARESVQATTEMLLARAPDVILEVRRGAELTGDQRRSAVIAWSPLSTVPAVKAGRVQVVSGDGLLVPGPRVADAVERFARALHPERFR